jgi:hypothetical protein
MNFRKSALFTSIFAVFVLAFGFPVFATHCAIPQCDALTSIIGHILDTVNILIGVFFVLGVALFGWGVAKLIYAAGDPTQIQKAKQFIWWGIIGMAILAMIGGILNWIAAYTFLNTTVQVNVIIPWVL